MRKKLLCGIMIFMALAMCLSLSACWGKSGGDDGDNSTGGGIFKKSVTVTLDANGGSGLGKRTLVGKSGEEMVLPVPTREGYEFDAWYDGYNIVEQDVFPSRDVTLTARYYISEDVKRTFSIETKENKVYTGDDNYLQFTFAGDEYKEDVAFLMRNTDTDITVKFKFEAYWDYSQSSGWFADPKSRVGLRGLNSKDAITSTKEISRSGYTTYQLTNQAKASVFKSDDKFGCKVLYEADSTFGVHIFEIRNIKITLEYTQAKGTLV